MLHSKMMSMRCCGYLGLERQMATHNGSIDNRRSGDIEAGGPMEGEKRSFEVDNRFSVSYPILNNGPLQLA